MSALGCSSRLETRPADQQQRTQGEVPLTRTFWLPLVLALTIGALPIGTAAAQEGAALDLPPGIATRARPLLEDMMGRMRQLGMSAEQRQMMMADMQAIADQLPPGIFLQLLELMPRLDMQEMLALHQQLRQGSLLQQPPGQVLRVAQELTR